MKSLYVLFIIYAALLPAQFAVARNNHSASEDSLRQIIAHTQGEEKLKAYRNLQDVLFHQATDRQSLDAYLLLSGEYGNEAQKQNQVKQQGDALVSDIIACVRCRQFDEMDNRVSGALAFLKTHQQTEGIYVVYKQVILSYCRRGQFERGISELQQLYQTVTKENDLPGQFYVNYLMGILYMHQDRLSEAEKYYRESIETGKKINNKPFDLLNAYAELCNMLQSTGQFDDFFTMAKETETLLRQLEIKNSHINYSVDWENLWSLYAYAYNSQKEYDKAEYYCNLLDSASQSPVSLGNTTNIRASILDARGKYEEALQQIDKSIELDPLYLYTRYRKIEILSHLEKSPRTWEEIEKTVLLSDSIRNVTFNAQLDELRTQYEVDKHVAEKERNRNLFLFALGGCLLLALALGIWIYYNRLLRKKNHTLVEQIRLLQEQQKQRDEELLNKTTFENDEIDENNLCPESRKDKLCLALRDLLLKDKIYHNRNLTRDSLMERLGINRYELEQTFLFCFGMHFSDYITELRLRDSIVLLEQSDLLIVEISEKIGFGDITTFQRRFRSKYNLSPKEYRKICIHKQIKDV
jgi:AraC-like DNA-binding protein